MITWASGPSGNSSIRWFHRRTGEFHAPAGSSHRALRVKSAVVSFTRPDCFGNNTGATIFTAVAIGISLVHDWRNIGSIHINSSIKQGRAPIFGTLPVVIDWPSVQATPAIRKNSLAVPAQDTQLPAPWTVCCRPSRRRPDSGSYGSPSCQQSPPARAIRLFISSRV